jgi:hypothetical protein
MVNFFALTMFLFEKIGEEEEWIAERGVMISDRSLLNPLGREIQVI